MNEKQRHRQARIAVRSLFQATAMGARPDAGDLAELGLPQELHREIIGACAAVRSWREGGQHADARRAAAEATEWLIAKLPDDWTPPTPGPDLRDLGPRELADLVRR